MNTYEIEVWNDEGKHIPLITVNGNAPYVLDIYNVVKGLYDNKMMHPDVKGVTLVRKR